MNNTEKLMLEYQKMLHSAYHKKVLPLLLKFKVQQKKYLCLMWFWIIMIIIATATADFYFKTIARDITGLLLLVNILALMAISGIISHHNSKFVKELKSHCLRPILQIFGNIQWKTDVLPNEILIKNSILASCFASMVFLYLFVFIPAIITNPELFKELIPTIILLIIPIIWTISLLYMSYKKKKQDYEYSKKIKPRIHKHF